MNHDQLRILVDIARQGSFSKVAKQRDLDPSSVSRIVQSVERELGVRLFQRSTRYVVLTEAGTVYLARVSQLLEELDCASDALQTLAQQPAGTLRITASVAFGQTCLVPLMPEFARLYPEVQLELVFADANLDMVSDRIDLALRLSPRMSQDAVRVKWFDASYKICASPQYLSEHGSIRSIKDLLQCRCVLFGHPQPQSTWLVRNNFSAAESYSVAGLMTASNGLAQRELVLAGAGPALMPSWLCNSYVETGQLVSLLPEYQITPGDFDGAAWLLYPSRTFLPSKTRAMVTFLQSRLNPAWQ